MLGALGLPIRNSVCGLCLITDRHDWGSAVCYEAGRSRPDIFKGIIGGVVPVRRVHIHRRLQCAHTNLSTFLPDQTSLRRG